jgi:Tol biopolymer transport system component
MKIKQWIMLCLILSVGITHGALEVTVVKKNENAFPIAVSKFKLIGKGTKGKDISKIIYDNLTRSGRFNVLQLISLFVIHDLIKSDFCLYFQLPLDNYRN